MIDSTFLAEYSIVNYKEPNKKAIVTPLRESLKLSEDDFLNIVSICSEPLIYEFVFNEKLAGRPYTIDNAHDFLAKSEEGWKTNAYFTFIIRDETKRVIGAIDIKSNNPDEAEIGYWLDENLTGYMTNAMLGLIEKARLAGYKSLVVFTRQNNYRSKGVSGRAGFVLDGKKEITPGRFYDKYTLHL